MKAGKIPTDEFAYTNCAVVNPADFPDSVKLVHPFLLVKSDVASLFSTIITSVASVSGRLTNPL